MIAGDSALTKFLKVTLHRKAIANQPVATYGSWTPLRRPEDCRTFGRLAVVRLQLLRFSDDMT